MLKFQGYLACAGLAVVSSLQACSDSDDNDVKTAIIPPSLQTLYDDFKYAPAIRAGDQLYLSGVLVTLSETETNADITPAINRAFDEIELILAQGGASWDDVVDVTSYMTDLDAQIGPLWAIKEARVPAPYPAWTAIGVSRLYGGDAALIEIKVTAYLPDDD